MSYATRYFEEMRSILDQLDPADLDRMAEKLALVRERGGRLFFIGCGGGAGHASHAVNDFRKIAGIESYCPTDNVSELTARINDDGWESCYANWLKGCRLTARDALFIFSVGGGNAEKNISPNIVQALKMAKSVGADVFGVVGRDGGYTKEVATCAIVVPTVSPDTITPHTESFQAVLWHLLVSHPKMKTAEMKWESTEA